MKIFKALPGKGDLSEKENIMKLASDYTDPIDVELDLLPDLLDAFKSQFEEMKKEGYQGSFLDYLKSEISLKKSYRAGGIVK
tara:strand:+ start:669 stop:914 length:246 start_codon:yes stop_codon:yes gene_type:complete